MNEKHWIMGGVAIALFIGVLLFWGLGRRDETAGWKSVTGTVSVVKKPLAATRVTTRPATRPSALPPRRAALGAQVSSAKDGNGIMIERVFPGSSAESAGLRAGDRIVAIGEIRKPHLEAFLRQMATYEADDKVELTILRDGSEEQVTVMLMSMREVTAHLPPPRPRAATMRATTVP